MLAVLYILLSIAFGFVIFNIFFGKYWGFTDLSYRGDKIEVAPLFFLLPSWFVIGIILMSWFSYIFACLFSGLEVPLLYADEITLFIAIISCGAFVLIKYIYNKNDNPLKGITANITRLEKLVFAFVAILFAVLLFISFRIDHGQLYVGITVFSDFTPHLSMIRSFSYGQNFPTQYSVCAGSDVRYHFMFEFLVGNLEFMGMPLDWAFNLPSFLSIMSMYSLLFVLATKITGSKKAASLALLFLTFRSSASLFYYISSIPKGTSVISRLLSNTDFIGSTNHEDWGLWNLNVYCNQRHLALGVSVLLFIVIIYLPHLYSCFYRLTSVGKGAQGYFKHSLFSLEGWLWTDVRAAIGAGIVLGALGFFNGAVLITTVLILFFIAACADRRFEFLITAVIAGMLAIIQSKVFIDGSTFSTSYYYGFISDNPTVFGSIEYILKLLGLLPVILLIYFLIADSVEKYIICVFSTPIIFAFTVSLTPDIAVNHKYIMMSVMLLNIFAAQGVIKLFEYKRLSIQVMAVGLIICLTATGVYDTYILYKRNNPRYAMVNNLNAPLLVWIADNCTAEDLFCTSNYYLGNSNSGSSIILSGAMMYNAWEYFGWSAGYDTGFRDKIVNEIYSSTDIEHLRALLKAYNFDYVVIDYFNRVSDYYELNEQIFIDNFEAAYSEGEGMNKVTIYRVN